jgi:predicted unusual protein kinase regulating ubiquinone biosynthesis (AarF/ABC1/UbiB family)
LARFHDLLAGDPRFAVPAPVTAWTTGQILAMDYVAGQPIEALADLPQERRDAIARDLIDLTLAEVFTHGTMQSDPNFANYRYDPETGRIVLLDFGATREIAPGVIALYRRLLTAGLAADGEALEAVAEGLGFFDAATAPHHRALILRLLGMVFAELREKEVIDFAANPVPARLQAEGILLAEEGFVPPTLPIDVLYLQRKFGGMFLLAARLGARVAVRAMIERHLAH